MPFDAGSMMGLKAQVAGAGDASGWPGGTAVSRPVTDLSPHVSGGVSASANANTNSTDAQKRILYLDAAIVLSSIALLWLFGAVVFRGIKI